MTRPRHVREFSEFAFTVVAITAFCGFVVLGFVTEIAGPEGLAPLWWVIVFVTLGIILVPGLGLLAGFLIPRIRRSSGEGPRA